jgi:hypothetical protein
MIAWLSWSDLGDWDWGAIVGGLAFVLALAGLWLGTIRPARQARGENQHARLQLKYENYMFGTEERFRLVLVNHGPARAEGITLNLLDSVGGTPILTIAVGAMRPLSEGHFPLSSDTAKGRDEFYFDLSYRDDAGWQDRSYVATRRDLA